VTNGEPGDVHAQAVELIDSVLADLAADRDEWSKPEVFQAVMRRLSPFSYRLAEDSGDLAAVPVGQVRDRLVHVLGTDGYATLLAASAQERITTAEFMLAMESGDPCAVEAFDMNGGPDPGFVMSHGSSDRLPLPLPYLLGWASGKIGDRQAELLIRAVLDDLRQAGTEWRVTAGCEPAPRLLLRLRSAALDLLARPDSPAQVRRHMEKILGSRAMARLVEVVDEPLARLAVKINRDVDSTYGWHQHLPNPEPDLPGIIVEITDWAGERFGADDTGALVRAMLADIGERADAWHWGDELAGEDRYWATRIVARRAAATTPGDVHRRLAADLNRKCLKKLIAIPPRPARHLGGRLNDEVPPSRWDEPDAAPHVDIASAIVNWARQWCSGDWWMLEAIEREE
jgi:hypothetical protein